MKTETVSPALLPSVVNGEMRKTLDALIASQGVAETARFEHFLGAGADLWADDEEFDRFLETTKAVRKEKG